MKSEDFKTAYTKIKLRTIPRIIFILWNSEFSEMSVVIEPAPAIKGKARGTIGLVFSSCGSCLKTSMFKTISRPKKNMISPPATAKEEKSTPKSSRIDSPINKNEKSKIPETKVILNESSFLNFFFRSIMKGIEPKISMTEKRIRVTEMSSLKFIVFIGRAYQYIYKNYNDFKFFILS